MKQINLRVLICLTDCYSLLTYKCFANQSFWVHNCSVLSVPPYICLQTILPYFINAIKPYIDPWTEEVNIAWFSLFDIVIFYMTEGQITTTTGPPVFNNVALKNVHKTGKQKAHTEAINRNNTVENNLEWRLWDFVVKLERTWYFYVIRYQTCFAKHGVSINTF